MPRSICSSTAWANGLFSSSQGGSMQAKTSPTSPTCHRLPLFARYPRCRKPTSTISSLRLTKHASPTNARRPLTSNILSSKATAHDGGATLWQATGSKAIKVNPMLPAMTQGEIDAAFDLPYTRLPHPRYKGKTIPAYEMIRHSVNMPWMFRRLRILHHFGASRQVHRLPLAPINPPR